MYTKEQVILTVNSLWNNLWCRYGLYAFIIGVIAWFLEPTSTNSSGLYSSITTILATIFAIIFSLIILLPQVIGKTYKTIDTLIYKKWFSFVFCFFFLSIMIPLFAMKTDYNILGPFGIENSFVANFTQSLCIASLAYAFLILHPISKEMSLIMKVNRVETLHYMGIDKIKRNDIDEIVRELSYIGLYLIDNNYNSNKTYIPYITELLQQIGTKSVDKAWIKQTTQVLYVLEEIGLKTIDKAHDTVDPNTADIIKWIKEIGLTATDKKLMISPERPVAHITINALGKMGIKAIKRDMGPFIIKASQLGLLELGKKAIENELEYYGSPVAYEIDVSKLLIEIYVNTNKVETQKLSMKCLRELDTYIHKSSPAIAEVWWIKDFIPVLKSTKVYTQYITACHDIDHPQVPYP